MAKKATTVVVIIVLHLVTACAPAAPTPTPTPEPTPTPVWVLATKPEHLAGLWVTIPRPQSSPLYLRFQPDGTMCGIEEECPEHATRFWFEDGVYYEDFAEYPQIGVYQAYLKIQGGRAVHLRFEVIDDVRTGPCYRCWRMSFTYTRVDK